MKFAFVAAEKATYPVRVLCQTVGVSREGFYAWHTRPPAARRQADQRLGVEIQTIHAETRQRYGSPRVHAVPAGSTGEGGVRGSGRDGLGTGVRGRNARARRAFVLTEVDRLNSRDNLVTAFRYYVERYETDPFKLVEGASEQGFSWPLLGTPYFYAGSMDGYIEWSPYGFLVLEHKTTSEYLSDSYVGQWEFSPQVMGYHWYLSKIREDTYGVLVNMIVPSKFPAPSLIGLLLG